MIAGLHETLALLTSQLHPDANHKEDLVFLRDVFSEKSLGYLMKVQHILVIAVTLSDYFTRACSIIFNDFLPIIITNFIRLCLPVVIQIC